MYYDLPVFKEVYKLILVLFEVTKDFPKEYKYTLGHDIKRDGINLVRSIYRANKAKNKVEYLEALLCDRELSGRDCAVRKVYLRVVTEGCGQFSNICTSH